LQERRRELNVEQLDLATRVGTNAPMMSAFEHYKCLPIPSMLKAIAKELNCKITDLYSIDEIYIQQENSTTKRRIVNLEPLIYKLTVELPNSARDILTQRNLEQLGYHSIKDFVWQCLKKFEIKLSKKQEKTIKQRNCSMANENDNTITISHQ
jgi:transcriptional regulator with XRE-family HTH domain